jgi:putative ABC transport system permease protein
MLDTTVLGFVLLASVLAALLFGIAPAMRAGRGLTGGDLHAGTRATETRGGLRLRGVLVAGQIALSVVLLVGSGLLLRTLLKLQAVDLGFDPGGLITTEISLAGPRYNDPARRVQFYAQLRDELRAAPDIRDAASINLLPVREPRNNTSVWAADRYSGGRSSASFAYIRQVLPGYFEAMKIPPLAGRTIQDSDRAITRPIAVINQSLARAQFGDANPVGRTLLADLFSDRPVPFEVVGVVGDERMSGQAADPRPAFYAPYFQNPSRTMQIAVRAAGQPAAAVQALRAAVKKLDANLALSELLSMEELIGRAAFDRRFAAVLLTGFAGAALFLAALGLYGVLAFDVTRRIPEIGVRMALGARASQVVGLFLRRGILVVAIGLLAGVLGSVAATRLLGNLLFQVPPNDAAAYAGAGLVLGIVAVAACLIPAWRAARVDPAVSLRME